MSKFNEAKKIFNQFKKYESQIDSMVNTMGVLAKNHFTANFRKQGFDDEAVTPWVKRKRISYRTRGGKLVDDSSRGILIGKGSGRLRRSIAFRKHGKWSVVINTGNIPYAKIHNEGGIGRAFGKYSFKMPKRQFIGYSGKLNRQIISSFNDKIKRIFA